MAHPDRYHRPVSVYDGIESLALPTDLQSWGASISPDFDQIVTAAAPATIIEVGSWKGVSAIRMAQLAPQATVHCVDTWLGSIDQHDNPAYTFPRDQHGYPTLYHQFLHNVKFAGVHDRVTPHPMTSRDGARFLATRKTTADLIFIDGDHSFSGCHEDIARYYPLLRPGGTIFGDDAFVFPSVYAAAWRFAVEAGIHKHLTFLGAFWIIKKPPALA